MKPEELYRIRENFHLNHEAFAAMIGVTREDIAAWEMGTAPIPNVALMAILGAVTGRSIHDKRDIAGWFYVIQLIPDLKPERLKFGFSRNIDNRVNGYRVSSPTAVILKLYPSVW